MSDTGLGLNAEEMLEVFEEFQRLHFDSGMVEGTGVSLSICKLLMNKLNGKIGVESQVNVGSCFWIDLPIEH